MTSTSATSELNIVLGAMTFGEPGKGQTRVFELEDVNKIIDVFQQHGHTEIDTARLYGQGTSEEYLGKIGWQKRGLIMETKLYPSVAQRMRLQTPNAIEITHSAEDVKKHFQASLDALQADKVDMFYLHGPDRSTPFDVTLKAVDDLYKQGKFKRFGISNYHCWEVAEMVTLCRANGWIEPTAYQGLYNALHRAVEPELFPALRKYGLAFYAYNPLGGGIFTGRYRSIDASSEEGARFDPNTAQGKTYRQRYWNEGYFAAIEAVEAAAKEAGLSMTETALRWISHHSLLKREHGDAVIIGASNVKHLEENLADLEKGPLPQNVVDAVNAAWKTVAADNVKYWH